MAPLLSFIGKTETSEPEGVHAEHNTALAARGSSARLEKTRCARHHPCYFPRLICKMMGTRLHTLFSDCPQAALRSKDGVVALCLGPGVL